MNVAYNKNNVFYKIISGELDADKIYEDHSFLCIKDINPVAPIHLLVIPKLPFTNFADFIENAPKDLIQDYYRLIVKIAREQNIKEYRVITNLGELSGQTVMHFHTHIIGGKFLGALIGT